jgi:dUTPase
MALKKRVIKKKPVRTAKLQPKETPEVVTSVKDVPTQHITINGDDLSPNYISVEKGGTLQSFITNIDCRIKFIQSHPDAKLPTKAHSCDNCWDLYAVEDVTIPGSRGISRSGVVSNVDIGNAIVDVGITLADITPGFGFVFKPRSGLGFKHGVYPHQGEIDCVPAGTKISTSLGDIKVEDLFEIEHKPFIYSFDEETNQINKADTIKDMWLVKDRPLLLIETDEYSVEVPPTKEIYTKRGWVQAQHLTENDEILCIH